MSKSCTFNLNVCDKYSVSAVGLKLSKAENPDNNCCFQTCKCTGDPEYPKSDIPNQNMKKHYHQICCYFTESEDEGILVLGFGVVVVSSYVSVPCP